MGRQNVYFMDMRWHLHIPELCGHSRSEIEAGQLLIYVLFSCWYAANGYNFYDICGVN